MNITREQILTLCEHFELHGRKAFFFFFLAEDGIRDLTVTGVQTCALPISCALLYGVLAVNLESKGYAPLSLIAFAVAWVATLGVIDPGPWRGPLLMVPAGVYFVKIGRASCRERV